jgi:NitT/TauT family transport system permease protein
MSTPKPARRVLKLLGNLWPPVLVVAVALGVWELGVRLSGVGAWLLPAPSVVAQALVEHRDLLAAATLRTARSTFAGFGLAASLGVLLGTVLASVRFLRRGVYPLTNLLQMVPLVAVAPLLTIWFGYGGAAVTASACLVALFPVVANTVDGLSSVDVRLRELFALYGASRWQRWWRLELPSALPGIFTGLRVAAGLAVIGAVVGEFVSGFSGDEAPLGIVVLTALREARTDLVFAAVALSATVGFALYGAVNLLAQALLGRWHPSSGS